MQIQGGVVHPASTRASVSLVRGLNEISLNLAHSRFRSGGSPSRRSIIGASFTYRDDHEQHLVT
jgi:hypothetical protein